MVRHAESPYFEGTERTRGLTPKGLSDLAKVTEVLQREKIDVIISSPYARAVLTMEPLAKLLGIEINIYEDLRERHFCSEDYTLPDNDFSTSIARMFSDQDFSLPGGESHKHLLSRAVPIFMELLVKYEGKRVALGTHGNIMTALMGYFNDHYDYKFFRQTTKPDIYKMIFSGDHLIKVERLWG
jgi:2,3-bisphosphoglycerate-dependent phosphoglycerate mutase